MVRPTPHPPRLRWVNRVPEAMVNFRRLLDTMVHFNEAHIIVYASMCSDVILLKLETSSKRIWGVHDNSKVRQLEAGVILWGRRLMNRKCKAYHHSNDRPVVRAERRECKTLASCSQWPCRYSHCFCHWRRTYVTSLCMHIIQAKALISPTYYWIR